MDDVRVNGDKIFENVPAVIDSGASYIFGEWNQVADLYQRFGGRFMDHAGFGYYSCEFRLPSVFIFIDSL
jgi:hypothetical protein